MELSKSTWLVLVLTAALSLGALAATDPDDDDDDVDVGADQSNTIHAVHVPADAEFIEKQKRTILFNENPTMANFLNLDSGMQAGFISSGLLSGLSDPNGPAQAIYKDFLRNTPAAKRTAFYESFASALLHTDVDSIQYGVKKNPVEINGMVYANAEDLFKNIVGEAMKTNASELRGELCEFARRIDKKYFEDKSIIYVKTIDMVLQYHGGRFSQDCVMESGKSINLSQLVADYKAKAGLPKSSTNLGNLTPTPSKTQNGDCGKIDFEVGVWFRRHFIDSKELRSLTYTGKIESCYLDFSVRRKGVKLFVYDFKSVLEPDEPTPQEFDSAESLLVILKRPRTGLANNPKKEVKSTPQKKVKPVQ